MVAKRAGAKVMVSEIAPHRLALAQSLGFITIDPKAVSVAERSIDCEAMITDVHPLDRITSAFEALSRNRRAMKSLRRNCFASPVVTHSNQVITIVVRYDLKNVSHE